MLSVLIRSIVANNGRQMGKPANAHEAREMLCTLSEGESSVSTGIAVVNIARGIQRTGVDTIRIFLKPDSPEVRRDLEMYLDSGDWQDKAGGYGIQSKIARLTDRIEGNYDTAIGLPTRLLASILGDMGIRAASVDIQFGDAE